MRNELLTIGRFARLCRLSVKQLRHYDDVGLPAPVRVDTGTGYRHYASEQARDALTIALLREMDLPLAVIAQALAAGPERRAGILRSEWDRLAERISRDQARLEMPGRLAEHGLPGYEVTLGEEPERRLALVRTVCSPTEIGAGVEECAVRLLLVLGGTGIAWEPPLWGLYPLDLDERMEIAVGAQTPRGKDVSGLEVRVLPGGLVAETTHIGPYTQLPPAHHALFAAIHERGLRPQAGSGAPTTPSRTCRRPLCRWRRPAPAAPCSATSTATSSPNAPTCSTAPTCAPATRCTPRRRSCGRTQQQ